MTEMYQSYRDAEVDCNTKNCCYYNLKCEQNCGGINKSGDPAIENCENYVPDVFRSRVEFSKDLSGTLRPNEEVQTFRYHSFLNANSADALLKYLIEHGFSIKAVSDNNVWTIEGCK